MLIEILAFSYNIVYSMPSYIWVCMFFIRISYLSKIKMFIHR